MLLQYSVMLHAMLDCFVDPKIRPLMLQVLIPLIKRMEMKEEKFSDNSLTLKPPACYVCGIWDPQHIAALQYVSGDYKKR